MKRSRLVAFRSGSSILARAGVPGVQALMVVAALFLSPSARAVILVGTGDSSANTTAPAGGLAGSGWDLQGTWGAYLGTPVAPNYFITAKHVGGSIGGTFSFGGTAYTTLAKYDSPDSDLTIWKVGGTFSNYAPLYTDFDEVGRGMVIFGRGTQRGSEVTVSSELKGWNWGTADHVLRWGQNTVASAVDGGASLGYMLTASFDYSVGGNEAILSVGDSGGAAFIQKDGVWKLAGINYGVSDPFRYTSGGAPFSAAIFDAGGLYYNGSLVPNGATDVPAYSFFTPISDHAPWILSVVPEPGDYGLIVASGLGVAALARRRLCRLG